MEEHKICTSTFEECCSYEMGDWVIKKGMSPAADADYTFKCVGCMEESLEDEGTDMNCFFSSLLDAWDCGSL